MGKLKVGISNYSPSHILLPYLPRPFRVHYNSHSESDSVWYLAYIFPFDG